MLLIGPPGSGKTHFVLEKLTAALRERREARALLVVPTASMAQHLTHELARRGFAVPTELIVPIAALERHLAEAPELPDGASWDAHREEVADLVIDTVNAYAPNFKASVLGRQILSPRDLERTFGLVGGDIFHGALTLDQMFWARPALGHADYRAPIKGLYMCGSGTHPGGGVTGAPGHNAAREIIRDFRRRRL